MDNALYVGLSNQMLLRRQLDIVANNIANADTTGFKVESLISKETPGAPAFTLQGPKPVKFVTASGVARDFGEGSLKRTDTMLDVAIDGQGFFKVSTPGGDRYTRDGHFRTDDTGRLTTQAGQPIQDESGGEITIDPEKGPVNISGDGTVSQGIERIGKIGVYTLGNLSTLEKVGDNLYQNSSNQPAAAAENPKVQQGMLESSNVKPIVEITRMIEVSRAYEQITHIMDSQADLSRNSITRMGRLQ